MSRTRALLGWLEDRSDWLSPIVVKEVRQMARGREFHFSFSASLLVGLAIAFYGAAFATRSDGTIGSGTFTALMACLTLLGMLNVPITAFSALRTERLEQTLDLVTVTALSPRRVVIGKLMAQAVKLATLFAALAPFMAMSFLLGGIDFFTIIISLAVLFLCSIWAASAFLFLSTLFKSRAMSGVVFGAAGIVAFVFMTFGRFAFFGFRFLAASTTRADFWWGLAMLVTGCLATTANFVLLAENRLTVPTGNRVTPLRIGFFAQFMLIVAWALSYLGEAPSARSDAAEVLAAIGGLHLALVAMFTVTEDLTLPRRALLQMQERSRWALPLALLRPGGGRGAAYVLAQMALLVLGVSLLDASGAAIGWTLGLCAYVCLFSGLPAFIWRRLRPHWAAAFELRVTVLVLVAVAAVLPDVIYYVVWQPEVIGVYGRRNLLDPFRTLANWNVVDASGWLMVPVFAGLIGLVAYAGLMQMGASHAFVERAPDGVPAVD